MMKTKLLFWLVFFSIGMQAQNINFPDANFKTILLSSSSSNTIAKNLSGNYFAIDADGDGEISIGEAENVSYLKIECYPEYDDNGNVIVNDCITHKITNSEGILAFKNLDTLFSNLLYNSIDLSGLSKLKICYLLSDNEDISNISLTNNPSLENLWVSINTTTQLNLQNLPKLNYLQIDAKNKTVLNSNSFSNLTSIRTLGLNNIKIDNLNLQSFQRLNKLYLSGIEFGIMDISNIPQHIEINGFDSGNFDSKNSTIEHFIAQNSGNSHFTLSNCNIKTVDISNSPNVYSFNCENNKISSLNITGCPKLERLSCNNNLLPSLNISNLPALKYLDCNNNLLEILNTVNSPKLSIVNCNNNKLTTLNFQNYVDLSTLDASDNSLTSVNVSGCTNLTKINVSNNQLTSLNIISNGNLCILNAANNQLTDLNILSNSKLSELSCNQNKLSALDATGLTLLKDINCDNNLLTNLSIKNSTVNNISFAANNTLTNICCDPIEINAISNLVSQYGYTNCSVNSSCNLITDEEIIIPDPVFKSRLLALPNVDINKDGIILKSEAEKVTELYIYSYDSDSATKIESLEGIKYFKNLEKLDCHYNNIANLDVSGLNKLKELYCYNSEAYKKLVSVNLTNCPSLEKLDCRYNLLTKIDITENPLLTDLNFSNNIVSEFIVNNANKLVKLQCVNNKLTSLNHATFPELIELFCSNNKLSSLILQNNYPKIQKVSCGNNLIKTIDISNINTLAEFSCWDTLTDIKVENCPDLKKLDIPQGRISSLTIKNCDKLEDLNIYFNLMTELDVSNLPNLKSFTFSGNDLSKINAENCTNLNITNYDGNYKLQYGNFKNCASLEKFSSSSHELSALFLDNCVKLKDLILSYSGITSLDLSTLSSLETIDTFGSGQLATITFNPTNNLIRSLKVWKNDLSNLDLQYLTKLQVLECHENKLTSLDISKNTELKNLNIFLNNLTEVDVTKNVNLSSLICSSNQLSNLDVTKNTNLISLNCDNNQLAQLDVSQNKKLTLLQCGNNNLETLDLSNNANLYEAYFNFNLNLENLFLKNGKNQVFGDYSQGPFFKDTAIKYICADDSEVETIKMILSDEGKTASVNTYCIFTPGGNFNTISGTVKIDANNNGCDASDNPFEFLKLRINDGTASGETFVQQNGKYEFYTQVGNFNITTLAENPALFNVSPANFSTNFTDSNNNVFTQDICVTANGTQNDAEVVIAPLTAARPGFDATYKLVWRNKGNTTLSGKVVLNYDHNRMVFQSSSLPYSVISNGFIEFNYSNLKPFANESTELVFTINTPTNPTNPVNSDDILPFNAQITPNMSDLTPEDNNFKFDQKVVNSFDPNDIVCMEGEIIPTVAVGKYMHYVVNFENTGTAEAENIVVKMNIDPAEFDINTLQLQNASADVSTVITGNNVEFRFKKIKLKAGGHGNVLLKMRSITGLQEGDTVNNKADIYFDYNFPVATNDYVTTILDEHSVLNAKVNYEAAAFSSNNYTIDFDASFSTGNIVSYAWEFPNAASVSSTSAIKPVVTYNVAGNYTAKLTVSDADDNISVKTVSFKVGNTTADLSTGRDNDGNFIAIDADDDDWKGYDINGTELTPKIRTTYTGWGNADISNGNNSRWISLNNFEGYYNYKSRAFTIPNNATDAKLNLRSLSFVRNWTYLVKINPDGSETETEITKTQWLSDGFKGWLNSRSPKVDNYALSPGTYYIKVLVYSNNSTIRESLDVNAIVTSSTGLMNANKVVPPTITLQTQDMIKQKVRVYPVPTHGELNIDSDSEILSVEVHDAVGRILEKKHFAPSKSVKLTINSGKGLYFLRIMTKQGIVNQKIIKE